MSTSNCTTTSKKRKTRSSNPSPRTKRTSLTKKNTQKNKSKKRENADDALVKKIVKNLLIYNNKDIPDDDMEDPSHGLTMVNVPVLNGGDNCDGVMMVTINFDKCRVRSLYQENILWHNSAMNAFAAGLMSELKYMSLKPNMPKIHFDHSFINYYQYNPTPRFDSYDTAKHCDIVFGFMQYMEKLEDGTIANEHWLLIRFMKNRREVYVFDSGTELTDDAYLKDLKKRAIYAVVGYGWCKTENLHLQSYSNKEWDTAMKNKNN